MAAYRKILCPVDGSKTSNRGVKEAVRLAVEFDAALLFLHVLDNSAFLVYPPAIAQLTDYMHEHANTLLSKAQQLAAKKRRVADSLIIEMRKGRVAAVIVAAAKKCGADLIVMGTHGRQGMSGLLIGSDAMAVVAASHAPVLLVR